MDGEKIRLIVFMDVGNDERNNVLLSCVRDDLVCVECGIIDREMGIELEITDICCNSITLLAGGREYLLKREEEIEFSCWTPYVCSCGGDERFFYTVSARRDAIEGYEKTRLDLKKTYVRSKKK